MQRARDRRRGQAHHIYIFLELLDLFFVVDAEPLLLVDDQKPQILIADILGKRAVRADHDVDLAGF